MSFNKTANLGSLGILILISAYVIDFLSPSNTLTIKSLLNSFAYFSGSVLLFISLYRCFKYTENSKIACKINLIGIFALIPSLAFDILSILGHIFPVLPTLYTSTFLRTSASIISYILLTLFLFSIYSNHISHGLNSILYKVVIIGNFINLILLIPYSLITFTEREVSFLSILQHTISPFPLYTIALLVFVLLIFLTYKGFLTELKHISEKTTDNQICNPT